MPTTVRNIRDGTYDPTNPNHVYIGRANARYRLAESEWHNPYPMQRGMPGARAWAILKFLEHLDADPKLKARVPELRGKTLYCWCAPQACHGDQLAMMADREGAWERQEHAGPLPEWARDPDATRHFRETGEEPSPYDYVPF